MNATDTIREAAKQIRRRAQAATGENWNSDHGDLVYTVDTDEPAPTAVTLSAKRADVAHIAGWGPATALAVADWLDAVAESNGVDRHALAVARAYLDSGWDGDPYPR
ncbi:hypothetical protein [Micromonospora sp. DPT]|uniref:hypothetical protein n=1 Tax=Micromonospora sp. DPT TaxID=3142975 RepID=UPI003209E132